LPVISVQSASFGASGVPRRCGVPSWRSSTETGKNGSASFAGLLAGSRHGGDRVGLGRRPTGQSARTPASEKLPVGLAHGLTSRPSARTAPGEHAEALRPAYRECFSRCLYFDTGASLPAGRDARDRSIRDRYVESSARPSRRSDDGEIWFLRSALASEIRDLATACVVVDVPCPYATH